MAELSGLLILGFGGHARSVADVALACGYKALCFIDSNAGIDECFGEFPVKVEWHGLLPDGWEVMPAAGNNNKRQAQCDMINDRNWPMATLVSPTATIGYGATIGPGTLVAHHAHIGPVAAVGGGCIINTGAIIEHECVVEDFSHVSVKAAVAGRSKIGKFCFIGAGSTVIDGISVHEGITLGAGACAHRNLDEPGIYVGVPAKKLTGKTED